MKRPKARPLLIVTWYDAVASIGWADDHAGDNLQTVKSVGWLVSDTAKHIILAADVYPNPSERGTNRRMVIPKAWIVSRRTIKVT